MGWSCLVYPRITINAARPGGEMGQQCWEFLGWVSLKSSMTFNDYIEKNLDTTVLHSHTPPLGTFSLSSITDMVPIAVAFRPRRRQESTEIN